MKTNLPSIVLFDFVDTIAELSPRRENIIQESLRRELNLRFEFREIARVYKVVDRIKPYSSLMIRNEAQKKEFYLDYNLTLLELLGVSHLIAPEIIYQKFISHKYHWVLKPGVRDLLIGLKDMNLTTGIISNFDSNLSRLVFDHLKLQGQIDYVFDSQTACLEKPSREFYLKFFSENSLDKRKAIYIGDSYYLDFMPAREVGLKSLLFDEYNFYPHLRDSIKNYKQLIPLLQDKNFSIS